MTKTSVERHVIVNNLNIFNCLSLVVLSIQLASSFLVVSFHVVRRHVEINFTLRFIDFSNTDNIFFLIFFFFTK